MQGATTVIPDSYNNPPIVEAVVEVRVIPSVPWSEDIHKRAIDHLRPLYPGPPARQETVTVQGNAEGVTSHVVAFHKEILPTADGLALIGVGNNLISVHVLAPYPGWKSFLPRMQEAVAAYCEIMKPLGLTMVSVRYVDKILLPRTDAPGATIERFFTNIPSRPASMPGTLEAFHVVTQSRDIEANYMALLTMASQPPTDQHFPILYDLALTRQFAVPAPLEEVGAHADFLHGKQRGIFEESITDSTRELFS